MLHVRQIVKSAFYPDKVRRHWDCPWQVNYLGFIPITWVLLTILLRDEVSKEAYSVLTVCISTTHHPLGQGEPLPTLVSRHCACCCSRAR